MYNAEIGDYIGHESCADIESAGNASPPRNRRRSRRMESSAAAADYPPPIPWLARTENRPSHMPWVMRRYYSGDGRLIIREEKVKHHEYFQVHRSNGRLVLNLVPLDDAVEEGEVVEEGAVDEFGGDEINGGDEGICDPAISRCYAYNGLGANTCGGFAAVATATAAFRPPVHT